MLLFKRKELAERNGLGSILPLSCPVLSFLRRESSSLLLFVSAFFSSRYTHRSTKYTHTHTEAASILLGNGGNHTARTFLNPCYSIQYRSSCRFFPEYFVTLQISSKFCLQFVISSGWINTSYIYTYIFYKFNVHRRRSNIAHCENSTFVTLFPS